MGNFLGWRQKRTQEDSDHDRDSIEIEANNDKAKQLLLRVEGAAHRVFGDDHGIISASANNLIDLYKASDKVEKAEQ